jgi:ubiquinone/menaquinone biosynthesis C-methylase UbiE
MESVGVSAYDAIAPRFERDRALPDGVAEAIRAAVLAAARVAQPRLLDLGAGAGRIGWPFVAAGDDYVGVDLSFGMLQAFAARGGRTARLVQADGLRLPFADASFDAVMLVQVFGGMSAWQAFAGEVRRVLRAPGVVLIGRTAAPEDGVDARMKRQLGVILGEGGGRGGKARENVEHLLGASAARVEHRTVASWSAQRTPRQFISRHRAGARFSKLAEAVKDDAMRKLGAWAEKTFGALDAASSETHSFELQVFRFEGAS